MDFTKFRSLSELSEAFKSGAECRTAIMKERWMDEDGNLDVICPYCGKHHCRVGKDGRFYCSHCSRHFSVLVGTIFENTKISLVKWFMAIYLISSHKKGISSCQLARVILIIFVGCHTDRQFRHGF